MESIGRLLELVRERRTAEALYWRGRYVSYGDIEQLSFAWLRSFATSSIGPGSVVGVVGEFSPQTVSLFFSLMQVGAIIVPLAPQAEAEVARFSEIAGVEVLFRFDSEDCWTCESSPSRPQNALISEFRQRGTPGLVVFSSGSTGEPKGILHDCDRLARRFLDGRLGRRTVLFLMMDHLGGFNTFFSAFCQGGGAVCLPNRSPDTVCEAIADSRATLLPTTPTFLNLLVASRAHLRHDLSSIELVTYGTEVMSAATLGRMREIFPNASLKQTYGLSEVGTLRSKSLSDESVWVKVGGNGFDVKVVDSVLWVRADANMVGYLNAPNPFDEGGWLCTGDEVEVNGEYVRIIGRKSDLINVGGQKVFPSEVENVLLAAEGVVEATVYGVRHPLMGYIVHARVTLESDEVPQETSKRLRSACAASLAKYKVPVRFEIVPAEAQHSSRFKKVRNLEAVSR